MQVDIIQQFSRRFSQFYANLLEPTKNPTNYFHVTMNTPPVMLDPNVIGHQYVSTYRNMAEGPRKLQFYQDCVSYQQQLTSRQLPQNPSNSPGSESRISLALIQCLVPGSLQSRKFQKIQNTNYALFWSVRVLMQSPTLFVRTRHTFAIWIDY